MKGERRHKPPERELTEKELAALTERVRTVRDRAYADAVESQAAMGAVIRDAHVGLAWGRFQGWVQGELKMKVRTAYRLMDVALLAENHPEYFDRIKKLGVTKVGDVAELPEPALTRVLRTKGLVEGTGTVQLRLKLKRFRGRPGPGNARAAATAAGTAALRLGERLRSLKGRWTRVPADVRAPVVAALESVASAIRAKPWRA